MTPRVPDDLDADDLDGIDQSSGDRPDRQQEACDDDSHGLDLAQASDVNSADANSSDDFGFKKAAAKVRNFPQSAGVYLMKDVAGVVIYVGKAKNLRSRASSYFLKSAAEDQRTANWIPEIADIDYLDCESEVDALLMESRLIKDIQPKHNKDLKDDKSFPYLMITTREEFPRVELTREPPTKGVKLYGPFPSAGALRGAIQVLQRIFRFRTCSLDISEADERWKWFRPCLLASINQCTAPCNVRITKENYRKDIRRLMTFMEGGKKRLLAEMTAEMQASSKALDFETGSCAARRNQYARTT